MSETYAKVDIHKLEECFSAGNLEKARLGLVEQIAGDSQVHVPMLTGSLKASMAITDDGVEWRQEYAKAVYYHDDEATNWTTTYTRDPHSHWFEYAKGRYFDDWVRNFTNAILKPLKG